MSEKKVTKPIALAVGIQLAGAKFEGRAEEIFEGVAMFLAVGVLTWMIFWMRKQSHSIFVGNSSIARKGCHFVLEAVSILKPDFPDIKIIVAGPSPFPRSISDWKQYVGYPAYVRYLVKKLALEDQVEFLGFLRAKDMANTMCSAHVFVLPSCIENSPNTMGEAMIMGVPVVAAFVGGVPDKIL